MILRLFVFSLLLLPAFARTAHASGTLSFDNKVSERQRLLIGHYFEDTLKKSADSLSIAKADLNEDGLGEFIIRTGCREMKADEFCSYTILAETGDTLAELGALEALGIELGNAYSGGVRNIIAFQNSLNDFDRAVYVWEPQAARYIMKK